MISAAVLPLAKVRTQAPLVLHIRIYRGISGIVEITRTRIVKPKQSWEIYEWKGGRCPTTDDNPGPGPRVRTPNQARGMLKIIPQG